jgi:hypothetical protein
MNQKFNKAYFYALECANGYEHDLGWSNPDIIKNITTSTNVWFQEFDTSDFAKYHDFIDYENDDDTIMFSGEGSFEVRFKNKILIVLVDLCESYIVWLDTEEWVSEKFNNIEDLKDKLKYQLDNMYVTITLEKPENHPSVFTGRELGERIALECDINHKILSDTRHYIIKFPEETAAVNPSFLGGFVGTVFENLFYDKKLFYSRIRFEWPGNDIEPSIEEALNRMILKVNCE